MAITLPFQHHWRWTWLAEIVLCWICVLDTGSVKLPPSPWNKTEATVLGCRVLVQCAQGFRDNPSIAPLNKQMNGFEWKLWNRLTNIAKLFCVYFIYLACLLFQLFQCLMSDNLSPPLQHMVLLPGQHKIMGIPHPHPHPHTCHSLDFTGAMTHFGNIAWWCQVSWRYCLTKFWCFDHLDWPFSALDGYLLHIFWYTYASHC